MIQNSTSRDAIHLHQVVLEKVSWPDPSNVTVLMQWNILPLHINSLGPCTLAYPLTPWNPVANPLTPW